MRQIYPDGSLEDKNVKETNYGKKGLKNSKIQLKIWTLILWLSIYLSIDQIVN